MQCVEANDGYFGEHLRYEMTKMVVGNAETKYKQKRVQKEPRG